MKSSTLVLLLTGIFAIVMLIIFLTTFIISENNNPPVTATDSIKPPVPTICNTEGQIQKVSSLPYERRLPYSNGVPYSETTPSFIAIDHTVPKLTRLRSLSKPVSPNHWLGSAMFGEENLFMCYPYLGKIDNNSFSFSWPGNTQLQEICNSQPCTIGQEQLIYSANLSSPIIVSCSGQIISACDIVNADALCSTVNWQFTNPSGNIVTAFSLTLTQGSPYVMINNLQNSITLEFTNLQLLTKTNYGYTVSLNSQAYAIFLPNNVFLTQVSGNLYQLPPFIGEMKFAHYQNDDELDALVQYASTSVSESEVDVDVTSDSSQYNVNVSYKFSLSGTGTNLMAKLPHQRLQNYTVIVGNNSHPLLGPYDLITTPDNNWHISETLPITNFDYPPVNSYEAELVTVWKADADNVLSYSTPAEPVAWMKWLGSIANLILLGSSLQQDLTDLLNILTNELSKVTIYNGLLTNNLAFLYDQRWNGIITSLGLSDCNGIIDEGNSFYKSHIVHHGYLVFAYAVAFQFSDDTYRNKYQETALYYARSLLNSSTDDNYFPLWRHKHWYLGYSLLTGIEPSETKMTETTAEIVFGYYACYLLALTLNQENLKNWSLAILATEISSITTNFQFGSYNAINVNDHFVQGTITSRDDVSYSYFYSGGNEEFPQKNASMSIPMLKPMTLISNSSLNSTWLNTFRPYVSSGLVLDVEPETLAYGLGVSATASNVASIVSQFVSNCTTTLPYGSTWSSVMYWVLSTYT